MGSVCRIVLYGASVRIVEAGVCAVCRVKYFTLCVICGFPS